MLLSCNTWDRREKACSLLWAQRASDYYLRQAAAWDLSNYVLIGHLPWQHLSISAAWRGFLPLHMNHLLVMCFALSCF